MRYVTTSYDVEYCRVCGKRLYRTWRDAAQVAERQRNRQGILVYPYHSRECDAYHVGRPRRAHKSSVRHQNGSRAIMEGDVDLGDLRTISARPGAIYDVQEGTA